MKDPRLKEPSKNNAGQGGTGVSSQSTPIEGMAVRFRSASIGVSILVAYVASLKATARKNAGCRHDSNLRQRALLCDPT